MLKITQNQYYGKESEVPSTLPPGSTVFTSDTGKIYLFPEGKMIELNAGGGTDKGYKELTFSFIGNGTANPAFIELKNDFGVTFTLSRVDEGSYELTTNENVFPENDKRAIFISKQVNSYFNCSFDDVNLVIFDNIEIGSGSFNDFNGQIIVEIRVYD